MAYDEYLGERIKHVMQELKAPFTQKKMMGGLIFMVNEKMCCGIHTDKKLGISLLMAKIGEEAYLREINKEESLPMDFTGRPMKGFIFIKPQGFDLDDDLKYWIKAALMFNAKMCQNTTP